MYLMTFKIKKVLENFENSQNTYDMFLCVCVCVHVHMITFCPLNHRPIWNFMSKSKK